MNVSCCFELRINVEESKKQEVCEILEQLGIDNFVEGVVSCDIDCEYDAQEPDKNYYDQLAQIQNTPLSVYNEDQSFLQSLQQQLMTRFKELNIPFTASTFEIIKIDDEQWKNSWKDSFKPIFIGDTFAVVAPWDAQQEYPQKHKIVIDPGMAFGTGQHETTKLCLSILSQLPVKQSFCDAGCGSGILTLGASFLGYRQLVGFDIDPDCVRISNENAALNKISNINFFYCKSNELIQKINKSNINNSNLNIQKFDCIVANILAAPLKHVCPDLVNMMHKNSVLVLSGILEIDRASFTQFCETLDLKLIKHETLNDWCALVLTQNLTL